ncbi:MAG: hypothetical protein KC442_13065 [Thermomicrobiales bacterium]|nr:hypothetical protein [Thermomicrobiales bacterium]
MSEPQQTPKLSRQQRRAESRKKRSAEEWIVTIRDQVDPEVIASAAAKRDLTAEQHLAAWEGRLRKVMGERRMTLAELEAALSARGIRLSVQPEDGGE